MCRPCDNDANDWFEVESGSSDSDDGSHEGSDENSDKGSDQDSDEGSTRMSAETNAAIK